MSPEGEPYSSKQRYLRFVADFRDGRIEDGVSSDRRTGRRHANARLYFRQYLQCLRPHRGSVAIVLALGLLSSAAQLLTPLFFRFVVDGVLLKAHLDAQDRGARLQLAGAVFLVFVIVSSLATYGKDYRQRVVDARITLSLRRSLFARLLRLPLVELWAMRTGGILSRLTGDVDATAGLLQGGGIAPALAMIRLVATVFILRVLNWRLALLALLVIPGTVLVSLMIARRIRPIYRTVRRDIERIDGRAGEVFAGIRVVRAFRAEARELLSYMVGRQTIVRKELFARRRELALFTGWGLLLASVNVAIVWYGGWLYLHALASIGDIMACQMFIFLLLNPVHSLVSSSAEVQRSLAAMERVFDVLAMPDDKPDLEGALDAPSDVTEIRFECVDFAYREGFPVIRNFDVVVPRGYVVALVGRSGAGKTTVTDLVARFHDPTHGRILLNGIDIRTLRLQSYRALLAIVQQDTFLFDGTIADNIAYGRTGATPDEIEDAGRRANAHEFIVRLPDGYQTLVGERGATLSGGQQQRLAIARAILAAPQILILDEATSSLDTESEMLIQSSMDDVLAGRTTFVIAHRLSTVRRANIILVLDHGRIIERGTHDELMLARGVYCDMVLRQLADGAADLSTSVR